MKKRSLFAKEVDTLQPKPMRTLSSNLLTLLLLLTLTCIVSQQTAEAVDLLVYTNSDSGAGSLRQAIADNASMGGGNNIVFSNGITSPIILASELVIGNDVSIIGPGDKVLTVSGNNAVRVFNITTNNPRVSLYGLTIANGQTGANGGSAILQNAGSLALTGCTITGNHKAGFPYVLTGGGGIVAFATSLTASNCTFSTNQGAIQMDATTQLQLDNCTFLNNTNHNAGAGVAFIGSNGIIRNCTFAGNHGGGGGGGALFTHDGMTILNSTFSGNSSSSTGGAIESSIGTISMRNTIVAGNTATNSGPDFSGAVTSGGYNFIGMSDGSTGWGATGDQTGTSTNPIDPKLGPLQDNGGPTMTMALLPGSPCIDQGDSGGITTDQRGAPRPFDFPSITNASGGDGSDIGAFEFGSPALSIQQVADSVVLSWPSYYGGFRLQSETDLTSDGWTNEPGTAVVVGNQFTVTNGLVTGNTFYRLTSP